MNLLEPSNFAGTFKNTSDKGISIQFATVDLSYSSGLPKLTFDGETTLTQKRYPHLDHFTPLGGERVMLINGVIIGRVKQEV